MHPTRRRNSGLPVLIFMAIGVLGPLAGCGGSNTMQVTSSSSSSSTSISVAVSPSTIDPTATAVCPLLAETVGLQQLTPIDSSSWRDERERIVVDAQREASLLRRAAASAPTEIAMALETGAAYADFVSDAVAGASDFDEASIRLAGFGDLGEVQRQAAVVATWRSANC